MTYEEYVETLMQLLEKRKERKRKKRYGNVRRKYESSL